MTKSATSSSGLDIPTPEVFEPLLYPARYKGAHGGRGGAKSHFFAGYGVFRAMKTPGFRWLCVREIQKSLKESAKQLVEDKIRTFGAKGFNILADRIETPGGGLIVFAGMRDHTAESIKSFEGFDVAWVEEANKLSAKSLSLLRPTIRKPNSELWFSWNPLRKADPVDALLRGAEPPPGSVVVQANWRDNPWFPPELETERRYDEAHSPHTYGNIWEGEYAGVQEGAYFTAQLRDAKAQGRIGRVAADPLVQVRACWDLGVGDATAIWVCQFVGKEVRVLDYIEATGQPLAYFAAELRERGWERALCVLPHDGARRDSVQAIKYEDHLRDAGFKVQTVANQGAGAARLRIEAARRLFPQIWFNETTTEAGREALGAYHEKRDDERLIGLGPEHDWSSHGADAFGLMCIAYEPQKPPKPEGHQLYTVGSDDAANAWMGA